MSPIAMSRYENQARNPHQKTAAQPAIRNWALGLVAVGKAHVPPETPVLVGAQGVA
jgi:uncharacterized phage protein gp47/JayE